MKTTKELPILNIYDDDSKEMKARRARYAEDRAKLEKLERLRLVETAEMLAEGFKRADLATRCGLTTQDRARIRAALFEVNEHLTWAK